MVADPGDVALRVRGLRARYGSRIVLDGIDLDVHAGAITGLIGPNGAGKSTLIKAVLRQIAMTGRVELFGTPLKDLRAVAYVPQRTAIDFTFPITVLEVALQGVFAHLPWWRRPGRQEREWALACLDDVGMADHAESAIGELSGGQAARVFIARAIAQRPRLFLLDEPFAAVDVISEERILGVLGERRDAGDAVVIVHHNLDSAPQYFDDLIVLNRRVVGAGAMDTVFTQDVLEEAFPNAAVLAGLAGAGEGPQK